VATEVDQIPGAGGRTPVASYPWDVWLKPGKRKLSRTPGEDGTADFTVAPQAMRAYVYREARSRSISVRTVLRGDDLYLEVVAAPRRTRARNRD
jgi:hypothetical protein